MIRNALTFCAAALFSGASLYGEDHPSPVLPIWIWADAPVGKPVEFDHTFANDGLPEKAVVRLTGDFCHVELHVNDQLVGFVEAFDPVTEFDILPFLQLEVNTVSLIAFPVEGPSAVAATLTTKWGEHEGIIETCKSWSPNATIERGVITPARWGDNELRDVEHSAEYNQWKEAFADASAVAFSDLPEGFRVEKVEIAADPSGSWVSMAFDDKDRLILGVEHQGILRLTRSLGRKTFRDVEVIHEDLEECRGLVFRDGALYANANDSKALYRLRDTTGDDQFDEVTLVQKTEGSAGHGRNDLALGPDWTVHGIHGDSVKLPDRSVLDTSQEDDASAPLGHWLSLGQDDTDWNVHARGLRNPYGLDFNQHGEAFTYDADNEGDVGLPFYRPSRINHLVRGANYGWRQRPGNTRSLPVYAPDSIATTFDVGRGSPTSVKFAYRSHFPPPWRDALFALDWAYGRIITIHLTSRGASYYASGTEFLTGRPLNVTDLDFDSHGNLYFITGGRKTRSALFRIDYDPERIETRTLRNSSFRTTSQEFAREKYSLGQRAVRQRLETKASGITADSECWTQVSSADPWIRNAARVRLEKRPLAEWRDLISTPKQDLGLLTVLLALVRQGNEVDRQTALPTALELDDRSWRRTEKLTLLRIAELAGVEAIDGSAKNRLSDLVRSWINSPDDPVTRESVRILAQFRAAEGPSIAMDLVDSASTQEDRLFYLERLSEMDNGWNDGMRTRFFKAIVAARQTSRGDRFMPPFFDAIEERALRSAHEKFASLLLPAPIESAEIETPDREFVQQWKIADFEPTAFATLTTPTYEEGLSLYRAGLCHHCHAFGREVPSDLISPVSQVALARWICYVKSFIHQK